jgi:hypothetical protein
MNKPFSSVFSKGTLKDRWVMALKDPAYITIAFLLLYVVLK